MLVTSIFFFLQDSILQCHLFLFEEPVWGIISPWIKNFLFLAPLAVGQRAYVMVRRPSVRALTFSLNIFFSETTYRILMKFHRNVPTMVLFRISWNNLIPSKTLVAMATILKFFMKSLKIFLSETIIPRATKFGM